MALPSKAGTWMCSTPNLAVVVLNWNAAEDTIRCVRRMKSWENLNPAVWVIDNASERMETDSLAKGLPWIKLIVNERNLGFAGGSNVGIRASLARWDAPVLLLNNDAVIGEDDVVRLLKSLEERSDLGLIAPLIYAADSEDQLISAGGKNPVLHIQTRIAEVFDGETINVVENVSGTVVLIRPDVFRQVGLLDENFFFSTEMPDLCVRARQYGYKCAVDARAKALHHVNRSAALRGNLYSYYIVRNRYLYLRKHHPRNFPLYSLWTLYGLALCMRLRLRRRRETSIAVGMGVLDGIRGRFGGQNERVLAAVHGRKP